MSERRDGTCASKKIVGFRAKSRFKRDFHRLPGETLRGGGGGRGGHGVRLLRGSASATGAIPIPSENRRGKERRAINFRSLPQSDGGLRRRGRPGAKASLTRRAVEGAKESPNPSGGAGAGREADGNRAGRFSAISGGGRDRSRPFPTEGKTPAVKILPMNPAGSRSAPGRNAVTSQDGIRQSPVGTPRSGVQPVSDGGVIPQIPPGGMVGSSLTASRERREKL